MEAVLPQEYEVVTLLGPRTPIVPKGNNMRFLMERFAISRPELIDLILRIAVQVTTPICSDVRVLAIRQKSSKSI